MHPRDYETLLLRSPYVSRWSITDEWYRNMRIAVEVECVDGPVVECASFWEHGREFPRGYVAHLT